MCTAVNNYFQIDFILSGDLLWSAVNKGVRVQNFMLIVYPDQAYIMCCVWDNFYIYIERSEILISVKTRTAPWPPLLLDQNKRHTWVALTVADMYSGEPCMNYFSVSPHAC